MKSKLALQVLTVCCSVALLGAYVVYAHRQAQPASPGPTGEASEPTAPENAAAENLDQFPHGIQATVTNAPKTLAPSSKLMINVIPRPSFRTSPTAPAEDEVIEQVVEPKNPESQSVTQRPDGSTVTTRVVDTKAPTFAPSSKGIILPIFSSHSQKKPETVSAKPVQSNGQILKPGTFRTSESPKLIGVIPPSSAPKETAPTAPAQTVPHLTIATKPRETIIHSTKSAPVFVAPRTIPLESGTPANGTLLPTPPIAGTPVRESAAPISPASPTQLIAPDARAPKPDASPVQQMQRQTGQTTQATTTPRPRFLAPGSKSIDLLLITPQPTAPTAPPAAPPTQFRVSPAPEKPKP